jgi:mono/diheme cytochrome c family protein
MKKGLLGLVAVVVLAAAGGAAWAGMHISAFNESTTKKYDIALSPVVLDVTPEALARGKHLAESIGGCTACHGDNLAGGKVESMGPLGKLVHPNITPGRGSALSPYSNEELDRLLRHGVKRSGTGVILMPAFEWEWWPAADRAALISYLRTVAPVEGNPGSVEIGAMGKVLDRLNNIPLDVARRVNHAEIAAAPAPTESAEYGKLLAIGCRGCHGEKQMAGGKIPGTPPDMAIPLNLTPHETGLKGWTYEDFDKLIETGMRKNGKPLDPFMPVVVLRNMNPTERRATWAYLSTLPPAPFGER